MIFCSSFICSFYRKYIFRNPWRVANKRSRGLPWNRVELACAWRSNRCSVRKQALECGTREQDDQEEDQQWFLRTTPHQRTAEELLWPAKTYKGCDRNEIWPVKTISEEFWKECLSRLDIWTFTISSCSTFWISILQEFDTLKEKLFCRIFFFWEPWHHFHLTKEKKNLNFKTIHFL